MKKLMISLFSLILIFVQPVRSEMQAAKARVDSPVFDFGTVSQGTKVTNEFVISNQGNAELHIQRVVPACGCTASSVDQERIPAGGQGKIKVEFDTSGFAGEKIKTFVFIPVILNILRYCSLCVGQLSRILQLSRAEFS